MYTMQPSIASLYAGQLSASNPNMMHLLRESMQHQAVLYCHTTSALIADMNMSQGNVSSESIVHSFLPKWQGQCRVPASCIAGQPALHLCASLMGKTFSAHEILPIKVEPSKLQEARLLPLGGACSSS